MSTQELHAFSPTGSEIKNTFECGTGTHAVMHFYADGARFVHEFGDDYHDDDPNTVSIDGHVVYVDENGTLWTEPALTFKDADGNIVRQGQDLQPIESPNINLAMTLAVKVEAVLDGKEGLDEKDWVDIVNRQAWNDASEVIHLEGFIREIGLMGALAAYAARAADEENGDPA